MPGSLLLGNDAYSDVSDVSGRSLDSKIGGKKVSFNKAVRVKQYPWKPDMEVNTTEHLTLPSNRFWFKVYKNKHESPVPYDYATEISIHNAWQEENMECIHDSLAPIAEVEDQEIEASPTHTSNGFESNGFHHKINGKNSNGYSNSYDGYHYHPTEPPVDYFDEMHLTSKQGFNGVKQVWGSHATNTDRYNYSIPSNPSYQGNGAGIGHHYGIIEESEENYDHPKPHSNTMSNNLKLPRTNFTNDSPTRRSVRRMDNSGHLKSRERRSRSHDDYMDNDNRFKQLRKADKSVSTEDLNFDDSQINTNRFFKGSRDIATQCYGGTLTRNKNDSSFSNLSSPSVSHSYSSISNTERLKNFKSPRSKLNISDNSTNDSSVTQKKDYSLEKLSSISPPREQYPVKNNLSIQTSQNPGQYNQVSHKNGPLSNGNLKPLARTENNISSILQKQANKAFNRVNSRIESSSAVVLSNDSKKNRENSNQINNARASSTVGYLRGRQIPLSEVNTNTNRKFLNRNNVSLGQSLISRKADENQNTSMLSSRALNSNREVSNGRQSGRYISSTNNPERRSFRNPSNSAKSYSSSFSEGDSSMIDWSLSGFHLAPKPDQGLTSISDSEYTVHRRPPLLMYIPGVSHHDRPAIEDDRLSALSDISRSEINDGLSSLASSSSIRDKNTNGDFRRRQSVREGKSKWLKWRTKS